MVAPSDPRWRAATVGGFTFGSSDPPYSILAVQAEKDGITTISGELMGKSLSILHIVVTLSQPPPYKMISGDPSGDILRRVASARRVTTRKE